MDVDDPLKRIANPKNLVDKIDSIDRRTVAGASSVVTQVSEISQDIGDQVAGRFISPSPSATSTEPTNAGFTGTFQSGQGELFGSDTYNIGGVNSGALQWGAKQSDGTFTAGNGAVIIGEDGIVIQASSTDGAFLTFKDELGNIIATVFQDGAGNLQFDLADDTKAFTFNDGNVVSGHGTGKDSAFVLHENFVPLGRLWLDASEKNIVLTNLQSGTDYGDGAIVLALKGAATDSWLLFDDTAGVSRFRFRNNGAFMLREVSVAPASDTDFGTMYTLNDGTLHYIEQDGTDHDLTASGGGSADGWTAGTGTWSYSSADDPTFVISINADMTATLAVGMRIKLTQTTAKYFIVTAVGAYSGGATLVTVYGGTDYDLANSAITTPFYSPVKAPFGFPTDPAKWTVTFTDTTLRSKVSPVQNTVYYSDFGSLNVSMPIGSWRVRMQGAVWAYNSTSGSTGIIVSLSTANNTIDASLQFGMLINAATGFGNWGGNTEKLITVTSKTTRYVTVYTPYANQNTIYLYNDSLTLTITFECAYL